MSIRLKKISVLISLMVKEREKEKKRERKQLRCNDCRRARSCTSARNTKTDPSRGLLAE